MTTRRRTSIPVLLVALLALAVGLVGTATVGNAAAGLTKSKVKKIATKVVKKQAPNLSVANANTLAGKPATDYLNAATVYTSTTPTPATTHTVAIPLAPGSYTIGYSALLAGGSGYSYCQVRRVRAATSLNVADDTSETSGGVPSASGYGALDIIAGDTVTLRCTSTTAFTLPTGQPAQIVVQKVVATSGGALTAARGTAGRGN